MADTRTTPDKPSSDYEAMRSYWHKVTTMRNGTQAMRDAGELYLPRFEAEDTATYLKRAKNAVFTNIYSDIVENLADRPFAKEVQVLEGSDRVKALTEDIDGQGNNLHNFAATFFRNALDYALDWIYVDFTKTNPNTVGADGTVRRKTITEERSSGARPYWVRVSAEEMIAVYSAILNGVEEFVYCRMLEHSVERSGWDEVTVVRVREIEREPLLDIDGNIFAFGPAQYRVWQQKEALNKVGKVVPGKLVWEVVEQGAISIGVIPIVPLVIGERIGNSWRINPALQSCVDLQMEYYEEENGLKNIKKLTAFPMLSASGVEPEKDAAGQNIRAPVGPRAVLYGPPSDNGNGEWKFIEPSGSSLTFLRNELKELEKQLRELGRQPLTQQTGSSITSIAAGGAATKGNSAIQRWALACKDALENAMFLTALWLKETTEPTVYVYTEFEPETSQDNGFDGLREMRKERDLSRETLWEEARRRNILSEEFDPEEERKRLEAELPDEPDPNDLTDALPGSELDENGDMSPEEE
jgi:hypothetical protein